MSKGLVTGALILSVALVSPPRGEGGAADAVTFSFEHADLQQVIKKVSALTGATFLFDPTQVTGKLTLLAPQKVAPAESLRLLESALALHGYKMRQKEGVIWVIPAAKAAQEATSIEVVPLQYAKAEEVATALAWVAPPGVRVVPYYPTNSLLISGEPRAVAEVMEVLRGRAKEVQGQ